MTLERDLVSIGLAPKEATVYLALLELGTASVQAIAQRAGIVRPTTYVILEHLARKGLVVKATGEDAKKMLFTAEDPSRLEQYLEQQVQEVNRRRRQLTELVPELKSAYASGEEKPRVRLFEGKDGLRAEQQIFISSAKGAVVGTSPLDSVRTLFPADEYRHDVVDIRVQAGVPSRLIYTTAGARITAAEDQALLRVSRFVPPEQFPWHAAFAAHGPLLSAVSFEGRILAVLIEHAEIADSFRGVFELAWEAAAAHNSRPIPSPS